MMYIHQELIVADNKVSPYIAADTPPFFCLSDSNNTRYILILHQVVSNQMWTHLKGGVMGSKKKWYRDQ